MAHSLLSSRASAGCSCSRPNSVKPLIACLTGLSLQQTRHASILGNLANNEGAIHNKKRVGRGPSSGHGKTSGRGQKGQKQHGKVKDWFQGGQTPLVVQHGTKGVLFRRPEAMAEVNLDDVQSWIDQGRLDATKRITPRELILSGLVKGRVEGVKILARGSELLKQPIDVLVSRASAEAIAAIEAAGGKIVTRYYTRLAIMRLVKNQSVNTDKPLPLGKDKIEAAVKAGLGRAHFRLPDPTSRDDFEYYRDPAHRGYMSYMVARGQSPSLYFKVPGEQKITSEAKTTKKEEEETLW